MRRNAVLDGLRTRTLKDIQETRTKQEKQLTVDQRWLRTVIEDEGYTKLCAISML